MIDRRTLEQQLGAEQAEAHGLAAELMALAWDRREIQVRTDARCHTKSFILLCISLARESGRELSDRLNWAKAAAAAAEEATDLLAGELEPLALAVVGNQHRCLGQLFQAGAAFAVCRGKHGLIGDPHDLAECLSLEASYHRVVRSFPRAEACLRQALAIVERHGPGNLHAKLHIKLGSVHTDAENWEAAISELQAGLARARAVSDHALATIAAHNLIGVLVEIGALDSAAASILELEPFYEQFGTPQYRLHRDWLCGRIALGRRAFEEASARLALVRDQFVRERNHYYASLVLLDLAEAELALGELPSAEQSASAAARALAGCGSATEALAAVGYLVEGIRDRLQAATLLELVSQARRLARETG